MVTMETIGLEFVRQDVEADPLWLDELVHEMGLDVWDLWIDLGGEAGGA